jgi:glutathione S-transferase
MSDNESLADIALLPFIRQFARVERQWYLQSPYPHMKQWLSNYLQSPMFTKVMAKYPLWLDSHEVVYFGQK